MSNETRERPEPTETQVGRMADVLLAAYPDTYVDMKHARRAVRHCHWALAQRVPPSIRFRSI